MIKLYPKATLVSKVVFDFPKFSSHINQQTKLNPIDSLDPNELKNFNHAQILPMMAGKLCYLSFEQGKGRNKSLDHLGNLIKQKHGSVLEHSNFGFLISTSRDISHEIVRHRIASYSQLSQRYVNNPQYLLPPELLSFISNIQTASHTREFKTDDGPIYYETGGPVDTWITAIIKANNSYSELADKLQELIDTSKMSKTDARKIVNQTARSVLPNSTLTHLVMTTNLRSWRTILEKRCSRHASVGIRLLFNQIYDLLEFNVPAAFQDYTKETLFDNSFEITTPNSSI